MHIDGARAERPLVLGHRGASADAPENTLSAFRLALDQGADGVELDVWRCGSGEVVVHHDPDTRRTAGTSLRIASASLGQLRALDVGAWKGERFRGERIPTLREALGEMPQALVNVELKTDRLTDVALPGAVVRALRAAGALDRCLLSSFDPLALALVRGLEPRARCGILFAADQRWRWREWLGTRALRLSAVHPQAELVSEERMRSWSRRRVAVNAWTADDLAEIARLAALGVSAIITNRPALARRALSCPS